MSAEREPLQDEAEARPEWRRDDEGEGKGGDSPRGDESDDGEAAILKDLAQRPPD